MVAIKWLIVAVCCTLIISVECKKEDDGMCLTPDRKPGTCIPLRSCASLIAILDEQPGLNDTFIDYLHASQCNKDNSNICCPLQETKIFPDQPQHDLLPKYPHCGHNTGFDRIYGGKIAGFFDYPWMALLEFEHNGIITMDCGGSLINDRYVLTAAHCTYLKKKLVRVRLGEFDINNVTDCQLVGTKMTCLSPIVQVDVAQVINHEFYNWEQKIYDIALIRLAEAVRFTATVSPICLYQEHLHPIHLFVSGWGSTERSPASNVKLIAELGRVDKDICDRRYNLYKHQICAMGSIGVDACQGDSGGPLMCKMLPNSKQEVWYQVGIISYGYYCGAQGVPGIYTSVASLYDWIRSNVKQ